MMMLRRVISALLLFTATTTLLGGCESSMPARTGFLGDYSKLEQHSGTSYRYLSPDNRLGDYHSFIIDPVSTYTHHGDLSKMELSEVGELTAYLQDALASAISDKYPVVRTPGPGVARLRAAITDVKRSTWWLNIHPGTKLMGAGTGSAALEAELIDSATGEQVAALVESQKGNQFELDTFSKLDDVKDVMDDWAKRFRERLDEAHGNP